MPEGAPSVQVLERVQSICLALPSATEQETWGNPTFRVRSKIFTLVQEVNGRLSIWIKAAPGVQGALIAQDGDRYFSPPYLGGRGWVGVLLDMQVDAQELADLILDSYVLVAPKSLAKQITL